MSHIKRRFYLDSLPCIKLGESQRWREIYLPPFDLSDLFVKARQEGNKFFITQCKLDAHGEQVTVLYEVKISSKAFSLLWASPIEQRIEKDGYKYSGPDGAVWDVYFYQKPNGLVITEVGISGSTERHKAIVMPQEIEDVLIADVSTRGGYLDVNLSSLGWPCPDWMPFIPFIKDDGLVIFSRLTVPKRIRHR